MSDFRDLTHEEEQRIISEIVDDPDGHAIYYVSPEDEESDNSMNCYFKAFQRGAFWDVWCYSEEDDYRLTYERCFRNLSDAIAFAQTRASETQEDADGMLEQRKNTEWEERPVSSMRLTGPFEFKDNTNFAEGWEMETEEDVFEFFRRHEFLFEQEDARSLYSCSLTDADGIYCWVAQGPQGEMRLEANEDQG